MNNALLKHYAKAYFTIGIEKDRLETFNKDLEFIFSVFNKSNDFVKFLSSLMVPKLEKDELLNKVFKDNVDVATLGFLNVLIKKHLIQYFDQIKIEFAHLYSEHNQIIEARIYTPFPLSKEMNKKLEDIFTKKYHQKVVFKTLIDKKVIGGVKIYIQDTLYDYSLDSKLNQIRKKLIVNE